VYETSVLILLSLSDSNAQLCGSCRPRRGGGGGEIEMMTRDEKVRPTPIKIQGQKRQERKKQCGEK
jgi:hypothetical protein